jgi:hypothetical protein
VKTADNSVLELKVKGFVIKAKPEKNGHPFQRRARFLLDRKAKE